MSKFGALSLAVDKPARIMLNRPDGEPLKDENGNQAYVDVLSLDSDKAKRFQRSQIDRRAKRPGRITAADQDEIRSELLATLTTGWYLVGFDGKALDVPFTEAIARELYADTSLNWLNEQVWSGVNDRENFMPPPAAT